MGGMTRVPERRTEKRSLRLPASLDAAIQKLAQDDNRTFSDWIVLALHDVVAQRDRSKKGTRT